MEHESDGDQAMRHLLYITGLMAIFAALAPSAAAQCSGSSPTWTSTPDESSVSSCISGASAGDTINVTAGSGSVTWTSSIAIKTPLKIIGPGASSLTIIDNAGTTSPLISWTGSYGTSGCATISTICFRLSGFTFAPGASSLKQPLNILGTCSSASCPHIRIDNNVFTSAWATTAKTGNSYGLTAIGDVFGVIDHNTINGVAGNYLQFAEESNASYLGVGNYGDNAWAQPEAYGSDNFLYFESNTFNDSGCCENEGTAGGQENQGGGRVIARFNTFNTDDINFEMGWHGTESNGRPRSTRAFEFYDNIVNCPPSTECQSVVSIRGGTGLNWGNTVNFSSGSGMNAFFNLTTYRTQASIGGWGACDGSSPYDTNDGTTYWSGTISSVSGSTITVSGSSPGWSTNEWSPHGAPYSVHDVTQSTGSEITGNGSNTLTIGPGGGPGSWAPKSGDSIQVLRAKVCIDQAGGRGAGILYSGDPANPSSSANEAVSPTYAWFNTFSGGSLGIGIVYPNTLRVIQNRDYYTENPNQAAQTSPTSPFNATTTIGMGHGTLANQPTTCTTGVGYWATDQGNWNQSGSGGQGELFVCTATNTWSIYYQPYTYPHPLIAGGTTGTIVNPPTNLSASYQ